MSKADFEIKTTLFGGYNRKDTEDYLRTVQNLSNKLQSELAESDATRSKQADKLLESEGLYKKLWYRSKKFEAQIEDLSSKLKEQEEIIKSLEETIRIQAERLDNVKLKKKNNK